MPAQPPPRPSDPPREELQALRDSNEELRAVLARTKEYLGVMQQDRRMRVMANILLEKIARFEHEEAERPRRDGRTI